MARKVAGLVCKCDGPGDLKRAMIGQVPVNSAGAPFFNDVEDMVQLRITEIKHNESGLAGVYKNRMEACYRVELENGMEFVIPANNVRIIILTGGGQVGG